MAYALKSRKRFHIWRTRCTQRIRFQLALLWKKKLTDKKFSKSTELIYQIRELKHFYKNHTKQLTGGITLSSVSKRGSSSSCLIDRVILDLSLNIVHNQQLQKAKSSLVCTLSRRGIEYVYWIGIGSDAEASHPCLIIFHVKDKLNRQKHIYNLIDSSVYKIQRMSGIWISILLNISSETKYRDTCYHIILFKEIISCTYLCESL